MSGFSLSIRNAGVSSRAWHCNCSHTRQMPVTPIEQEEPATQQTPAIRPDTQPPDIRPPAASERFSFLEGRKFRVAAAGVLGAISLSAVVFLIYYIIVAHWVDQRLAAGPFSDTVDIFSSPRKVSLGDALTADQLAAQLRRSGYTSVNNNPAGWFSVRKDEIAINPGRDSRAGGKPVVIEFARGKVARIISVQDHAELKSRELEPELIANLSGSRERRRLVRFTDIPPSLLHAVVSVEDKHFFHHTGFDLPRILKAAWVDVKTGRKDQGASTLSMQLARSFWLDPGKNWKRKLEELMITMHMEHRLTKQQIFEYYANQVYLGRRDTFSISGFAEGSQAYFGKDLSQLSNAEAALLAGLVQRPSYYNPYRYPNRARQRRNLVLSLMRRNNYLANADYRAAVDSPLKLIPEHSDNHEAQYFVDLLRDEVRAKLGDAEEE